MASDQARDHDDDDDHDRPPRRRRDGPDAVDARRPAAGGDRADPGDLRGRSVHPRRRRTSRRARLPRRCAGALLALRPRLRGGQRRRRDVRRDVQGRPARRGTGPAGLHRRARRAGGDAGHRRGTRRARLLPRRDAGVRGGRRGVTERVRQLLRLRRTVDARPARRRRLPDAVPLRQRRPVDPGRRRRRPRRGDRRTTGAAGERGDRRPRVRQPRPRRVLERGGGQRRLDEDRSRS